MKLKVVSSTTLTLGALLLASLAAVTPVLAQSNLALRVMAANITSGNGQSYLDPGIRIFQGLKPDVVCIQEFNYGNDSATDISAFVAATFGPNFQYTRETNSSYDIPNGVISRWPIIASGSWDDTSSPNRGFAWAQIDLPGTNDLYVISVHLLTSSSGIRNTEATNLKALIQSNILATNPNAWIVIGGDCNTDTRSEACIGTFKTFLSDTPIPADAESGGNEDTNAGRSKPYDYVLPSFSLTNFLTPSVVGTRTFPKGLVFDSRVYSPLSDVSPVQSGDSGAVNMQHMAVVKDFLIPVSGGVNTNPPSTTTQPISQTNAIGGNVTFSVVASGATPLAYQWRLYNTNLSGATVASLALTNIQPINAGDYTVVITNAYGSVTSAVAKLTVNAAPIINTPPQSLSVNAGANAAFTVFAAGGAPLFYQWRFAGTDLSSATNSVYTRSNAQPADAGNYSVVVSNYAGSVTSSVAALTVNVTPAGIIAQWNFNSAPADGVITTGSTTPSVGSGTAALFGGATATFATGDTAFDPAATDNSGWNTAAYPAQGAGNKTRGVQFNVITVGRQNILVTWALRVSSTASKYSRLQYTTNGTDFLDFPTPVSLNADTVFERKTNDLSSLPGVSDNSNFAIRFVSEFEGTAINNGNANYVTPSGGAYATAGTGTMRYDMITVYGSQLVTGTAPVITNQPVSQATSQGNNATFTVGADGTLPLSYQWRFNLADISGATSATYTRSNVQPAYVGSYSVIVSNSAGFTTSSNVALTLIVPRPALTMPAAGILEWQGLSNLTYTIQTSTNLTQTNWAPLGTATSPSGVISFTNAPATNAQRYYRVVYP